MQDLPLYALAVFLCGALVADAIYGFVRKSRGEDEVVGRRLAETADNARIVVVREQERQGRALAERMPFHGPLSRLVAQSGSALKLDSAVLIAGGIAAAAAVLFTLFLPARILIIAYPLALAIGAGPMLLYYVVLRNRRVAKFEEQLPDAIDLVVRSLRVGHPLSASIGVIAREMPAPIGREFAIASEAISYGLGIPDALRAMIERVPLQDLGYLMVAVQIQQEAGGNLVESLSKLAGVIRERFRMFRKVKAITAEGRLSAWLLSFFPILIGLGIQFVKPDYYIKVADFAYFTPLVIITAIMLVVNILVMVWITKLKV
ncbi:MAG: type II secretion system F family protein [Alphaproteobacteria bacterium]|nr:type II secretion system F family protein [Alphaproteobacteria bacterium]